MNTLKTGTKVKSTSLGCIHIIQTVTDKKVSYTPQGGTDGLKAYKNTIKVFTTSLKKANEWVSTGVWVIL